MREFYFKDDLKRIAFRGIVPSNEVDLNPLDYIRFILTIFMHRINFKQHNTQYPNDIPEELCLKFVQEQVNKQIDDILSSKPIKPEIHQLMTDENMSSKIQEKLFKGKEFTFEDILWLNKEAQDNGYLLDIYHKETYPEKFKEKQKPFVLYKEENGTVETIGDTNMTEGEMRALLEQRKVIQARLYHKGNHWHCFYYTFKGLAGMEKGSMGANPHYHYISDKFGITRDKLMDCINKCQMPTSRVHIIISGNHPKHSIARK